MLYRPSDYKLNDSHTGKDYLQLVGTRDSAPNRAEKIHPNRLELLLKLLPNPEGLSDILVFSLGMST